MASRTPCWTNRSLPTHTVATTFSSLCPVHERHTLERNFRLAWSVASCNKRPLLRATWKQRTKIIPKRFKLRKQRSTHPMIPGNEKVVPGRTQGTFWSSWRSIRWRFTPRFIVKYSTVQNRTHSLIIIKNQVTRENSMKEISGRSKFVSKTEFKVSFVSFAYQPTVKHNARRWLDPKSKKQKTTRFVSIMSEGSLYDYSSTWGDYNAKKIQSPARRL